MNTNRYRNKIRCVCMQELVYMCMLPSCVHREGLGTLVAMNTPGTQIMVSIGHFPIAGIRVPLKKTVDSREVAEKLTR